MVLIDPGGPTLEFQTWFGDNIRARMRPEDLEAERYWTEAAKNGVAADKVALAGRRVPCRRQRVHGASAIIAGMTREPRALA